MSFWEIQRMGGGMRFFFDVVPLLQVSVLYHGPGGLAAMHHGIVAHHR